MTPDEPDPSREPGQHPKFSGGIFFLALTLTALTPAAIQLIAALSCLGLAFLFALYENALQYHSRVRLVAEAKKQDKVEALDAVLRDEDELLFATKLLRGLTQIAGIVLVVVALFEARPTSLALVGWTIGLTSAFLILNVAGPYLLGRRAGHLVLLRGLIPYAKALRLTHAPARLLQRFASKLIRAGPAPDPEEEMADELMSVVEEGTREGTLAESEKEMIEGILDLRDITAEHVMTPRTELVCLPVDTSAEEAIGKAQEDGHSRLPIYRGTPDEIIGVLYMKDLLSHWGRRDVPPIEQLVRPPFFVPQTKNVGELLAEMRFRKVHLAVVVDEYGGTAGVVSIEDILEEIVGEIVDEHEKTEADDVVRINEHAATVEGKTHIDDLNEALELDVPESEEYETVGGLLFTRLGRVPASGEHYDLNGVRFTVLDADERRVHRVRVTKHSA